MTNFEMLNMVAKAIFAVELDPEEFERDNIQCLFHPNACIRRGMKRCETCDNKDADESVCQAADCIAICDDCEYDNFWEKEYVVKEGTTPHVLYMLAAFINQETKNKEKEKEK